MSERERERKRIKAGRQGIGECDTFSSESTECSRGGYYHSSFVSLYHSLTLVFNFPMSVLCFGALSFLIVSSALLPPLSPHHSALLQSLMSWLKWCLRSGVSLLPEPFNNVL